MPVCMAINTQPPSSAPGTRSTPSTTPLWREVVHRLSDPWQRRRNGGVPAPPPWRRWRRRACGGRHGGARCWFRTCDGPTRCAPWLAVSARRPVAPPAVCALRPGPLHPGAARQHPVRSVRHAVGLPAGRWGRCVGSGSGRLAERGPVPKPARLGHPGRGPPGPAADVGGGRSAADCCARLCVLGKLQHAPSPTASYTSCIHGLCWGAEAVCVSVCK